MTSSLRALLPAGFSAALLLTIPAAAPAQDYPNRPITMIVGFPPGGSTDAAARIIQDPMSDRSARPS